MTKTFWKKYIYAFCRSRSVHDNEILYKYKKLLVVMHSVGERVVEREAQCARGAGRGGCGQHAARAPLGAARRHQQSARVRHTRRPLPPTPTTHKHFI